MVGSNGYSSVYCSIGVTSSGGEVVVTVIVTVVVAVVVAVVMVLWYLYVRIALPATHKAGARFIRSPRLVYIA